MDKFIIEIKKKYKFLKRYLKKIKLFIDEPVCRRLFVIILAAISLILIGLSTFSTHDNLFDTWYYYTIHFLLSIFGIFILFRKSNSKILFIYILLSSGLLISASFAFFWYSGQQNIIENTCISNYQTDCTKAKKYFYDKMMKMIALIIVELCSLHPNIGFLIKLQKIERKKENILSNKKNQKHQYQQNQYINNETSTTETISLSESTNSTPPQLFDKNISNNIDDNFKINDTTINADFKNVELK